MEATTTTYNTKYADFIKEKNFYQLLLNVKTELRKLAKKSNFNEFFNLLIYAIKLLNENKEDESCITLNIYALDEYSKYFNKNEEDLCLNSLKMSFDNLPRSYDKSQLKHKLLKFFESKNISDTNLQKYEFYRLFALDALNNNDVADGYRYALKSEDFQTVTEFTDRYINENLKDEDEKKYFIARVCLELILMKTIPLAFKFISKYTDNSNNFQNNHPIINFAYLLVSLLIKDANDFNNFWTLINMYKPVIDNDGYFPKYLNKISLLYYNRSIIQESGLNLMNLLKAFSNN
jgi:hypothetical protein